MTTENGSAEAGNPDNANNEGGSGFDFGAAVSGIENEELRGWIENKGFDGVDKIATSYRNLEQMYGADKAGRTIIRPGDNATPDDMGAFYNSLGRPEDAVGYSFSAPEGQGSEFTDWAKGVFHEAGLSDKQAGAVVEKWNEYMGQQAESAQSAYGSQVEQDANALQKEWGAAYDKNVAVAQRAAREFGIGEEQVDALENALGFGGLMKFMANIGSKLGEDSFEGSGTDNFSGMTPAQAKSAISDLKNDPEFRKRYMGGDKDAQAKMDQLHEWAYGSRK